MIAYDDAGMDKDTNANSIVLKLTYGAHSFLFTGDCESSCEKTLQETEDVNVDVYKAGHHGSSSSSTDAFLSEVTPSAVVISVGAKNQYGHPSPIALKHIAAYTDAVFRTDEHGTITLSTDGQEVTLSDAKGALWWKN
jgi:competence protein ComEC